MISYYNSKHPGLFIYITLVIVSVLSFLFFELKELQIGILSIIWGGFIFMRILSLYEVSEHFMPFTKTGFSKSTNNNSSPLAHDLLHRMNGTNYMKRGIFALHAIEGRTLLWFGVAFIYVAYSFYLSHDLVPRVALIQNISIFFIIGAGFWAGQTYAYSDHASKLLLIVFTVLFGTSLLNLNWVINSSYIDILNQYSASILDGNAFIVLAILIFYCILTLFASSTKGMSYALNAVIGSILLLTLSILSTIFEHPPQMIALWISGWSLFSVFWVRSYCRTDKRYVLFQCE